MNLSMIEMDPKKLYDDKTKKNPPCYPQKLDPMNLNDFTLY